MDITNFSFDDDKPVLDFNFEMVLPCEGPVTPLINIIFRLITLSESRRL